MRSCRRSSARSPDRRGPESFQRPGLDVRSPDGAALPSLTFRFDWLPGAGTLMLISGLITMAVIGLSPGRALRIGRATLIQLRGAILVVTAVLALAYVVNQSGQTLTLGLWAAQAGPIFAFVAPAIGWLGVAVTGSDTASNALFGGVQVVAAATTPRSPRPGSPPPTRRVACSERLSRRTPRHRGRGGRHRGARGGALSQGCGLEPRPPAVHMRARLPAIDVSPAVDGAQVRRRGCQAPKERE